jgi:hypothetical protein
LTLCPERPLTSLPTLVEINSFLNDAFKQKPARQLKPGNRNINAGYNQWVYVITYYKNKQVSF